MSDPRRFKEFWISPMDWLTKRDKTVLQIVLFRENPIIQHQWRRLNNTKHTIDLYGFFTYKHRHQDSSQHQHNFWSVTGLVQHSGKHGMIHWVETSAQWWHLQIGTITGKWTQQCWKTRWHNIRWEHLSQKQRIYHEYVKPRKLKYNNHAMARVSGVLNGDKLSRKVSYA